MAWLSLPPQGGELANLIHKGEQPGKKYRGTGKNPETSLTLSYQREGGPVVGVRVALSQFDHGALQCQRLGKALLQACVERDHELFGAAVVNVPKTKD